MRMVTLRPARGEYRSTLSCVCQMNGPTMSEIEIQKYKIGAIKELNLTNQI